MTASEKKPMNQVASDRSVSRIKELLLQGLLQADMVRTLNSEGYTTIRMLPWTEVNLRQVLWKLRWQTPTWYGLSARRAGLEVAKGGLAC